MSNFFYYKIEFQAEVDVDPTKKVSSLFRVFF